MAKQANECSEVKCPVYEILDRLSAVGKCSSDFMDHLKKARVELLLAVRSIIDQRVADLTKEGKAKPRARRIKVTEAK